MWWKLVKNSYVGLVMFKSRRVKEVLHWFSGRRRNRATLLDGHGLERYRSDGHDMERRLSQGTGQQSRQWVDGSWLVGHWVERVTLRIIC